MTKKSIRLTESQFHNIIAASVKRVLKEANIDKWTELNDAKYKQAINVLSKHVLNQFDEEDMLNNPDIIENEVHDCWQDILTNDILDAVYDKYDIACVTDKNCYGGGGYEVIRKLEMDVRDNVLNILKRMQ